MTGDPEIPQRWVIRNAIRLRSIRLQYEHFFEIRITARRDRYRINIAKRSHIDLDIGTITKGLSRIDILFEAKKKIGTAAFRCTVGGDIAIDTIAIGKRAMRCDRQ